MFNHNNIQTLSQARAVWHIRIDHVRHLRKMFYAYGVATISRLLKITGLFCKTAL